MSNENGQSEQDQPRPTDSCDEGRGIIRLEPRKELDEQRGVAQQVEAGELSREEVKGLVEALLFAAAGPLSAAKLAGLAGTRGSLVRSIVEELKAEYDVQSRAFTVEQIAGGYQLLTRQEFHPWVSKLRQREREETLSQAALETLAIVAYRQPIMRAEIEDIRGVQSGYILRSLIEKSLVRVTGRGEELGRPLLYGTTDKFLQLFGLSSLDDLPKLEELDPPSGGN